MGTVFLPFRTDNRFLEFYWTNPPMNCSFGYVRWKEKFCAARVSRYLVKRTIFQLNYLLRLLQNSDRYEFFVNR